MRTTLVCLIACLLTINLYSNENSKSNKQNNVIDTLSIDSINRVAFRLRDADIDSAVVLIERMIDQSRKYPYEKGLGTSLLIRGIIHKNKGEFTDAHKMFDEALLVRQKLGDSVGVATVFHNISSLELMQNNFGNAIENSNKAIRILEKTEERFRLGSAYINLANVYEKKGNYTEAIEWYNKAKSKLKGYNTSLALVNENLAIIFVAQGKYEKALTYFYSSLETYISEGNLADQAQINNNIGHAYFEMGQPELARSFFERSAEQAKTLGNDLLLGDAYANLGVYYMRSNSAGSNLDSAAFFVEKLEEILADSVGSKDEKLEAALLFSEIYQKNGAYDNALIFLRKAYNINADIKEVEQAEKLAKERAKLDFDKQQLIIQNQFYFNIMAALAILCCLGGLFFLFRTGRSKAKELQHLIETKDLEFISAKLKGEQLGRDKVARQLHDDVSPTTVAIKRELEIAKKNTHDLEVMLNSLNIAMGITDKVYEKTRQLAYELKTKPLDWLDDIKFDINQLQREDIESRIIVHEIDESINEKIGTEVSKILNVLLHNVRKHASASKVSVDLTRISDELVIIIEDDGVGFNTNKQGLGLRSVKARVKDLKGAINIDSKIGKGTTIIVNIPLSGAAVLQSE